MTDQEPTIIVNGRNYPLPTSYTLGEQADMERITGQAYDMEKGGALALLAITYIAVRRENPEVTVEQIRNLADGDIDVAGVREEPLPPANGGDSTVSMPPSSETSEPVSEDSLEETLEASGTPV